MTYISAQTESELAALADGSLEPERRAEILARVTPSPQLSAELEAQRRALALMHGAEISAPDSLGEHLQSLLDAHAGTGRAPLARSRSRPRPLLAGALAGGRVRRRPRSPPRWGSGSTPGLRDAFALTLRPATIQAPRESHAHPGRLTVAVEGVSFPYWSERFGWRATGARTDLVGGRQVRTVFYADAQDHRIGYAILAGPAPSVHGGTVLWRRGVRYLVLANGGFRWSPGRGPVVHA